MPATQSMNWWTRRLLETSNQPTIPRSKRAELIRENEELKATLSQLQAQLQKESEKCRDYQVIRDKVLTNLKLGKQAPGYKSAVKALNRFIAEIQ